MASLIRSLAEGHEQIARSIQDSMWEGKPFKSKKKVHTVEELEFLLEGIRLTCWRHYDDAAVELGWRD